VYELGDRQLAGRVRFNERPNNAGDERAAYASPFGWSNAIGSSLRWMEPGQCQHQAQLYVTSGATPSVCAPLDGRLCIG